MQMEEVTQLNNMVRIGKVSVVDVEKRLVRVIFNDKQDEKGNPLVSGWIKVLQNQPLVTVEKWVVEVGEENKWDYETHYNSEDRKLGLGESYGKDTYETRADVINNEKIIKYEKRETISEGSPIPCSDGAVGTPCPLNGIIEYKKHRQTVTVYPWLPHIDQLVVCIYLPMGESDGFVLGGI